MTNKLQPVKPQRKALTDAQTGAFRKWRGNPQAPTKRTPAPALPGLSAAERAQEHVEEKNLRRAWDAGRITSSFKGT